MQQNMNQYKSRKKYLNQIINNDQLTGAMNTTKWNELFNELNKIEELISYRIQDIDGTWFPEDKSYTAEIEQIWGDFKANKFMEINCIIKEEIGRLVKPIEHDLSKQIIDIVESLNIPYEKTKNGIRVIGYYGKETSITNGSN